MSMGDLMRNPQSNAIIERIHQMIRNIIRTFDVNTMNKDNPWTSILLAAAMCAIRTTYHTTPHASPMQLVFGRDAILNIKHITNWDHITQFKQEDINANKKRTSTLNLQHCFNL
jgi:hypothetical protein